MTARLLLLSAALALSACGGGSAPVSLGVTNATSSLVLSVTYALDGVPIGTQETIYPGSETTWVEAAAPAPSVYSRYEIAVEYSSGRIETVALDAADVPAEWIHVRLDVSSMLAEASPGASVTVARAPRGDLAPGAATPPATDAPATDAPATGTPSAADTLTAD